MIPTEHITGLVLAGGRGTRMGGLDKGLRPHGGEPLALHALRRLAPQVGRVMLNANRNEARYAAIGEPFGAAVWADSLPDRPGPLAGFLTGLEHCDTPWLLTVPCDTPLFPLDLAARLAAALAETAGAQIAVASTIDQGVTRLQPAFCLLRADLIDSLRAGLAAGERRISAWTARHRRVEVHFDDAAAFANANTDDELRRLDALAEARSASNAGGPGDSISR